MPPTRVDSRVAEASLSSLARPHVDLAFLVVLLVCGLVATTAANAQTCSLSPSCETIVERADAISAEVVDEWLASRAAGTTFAPELDRTAYATLFDAVECRTGVPASLMRAFAYSESLGSLYADKTPRHFIEPCAREPGVGDLSNRFYGGLNGPTLPWPLVALGAPFDPAALNALDLVSNWPLQYPRRPMPDPAPGAGCTTADPAGYAVADDGDPTTIEVVCSGDPTTLPSGCCNSSTCDRKLTWESDIWPFLAHVPLGDDRDRDNYSLGIGSTQITIDRLAVSCPVARQNTLPWWDALGVPAEARRTWLVGERAPNANDTENCELFQGFSGCRRGMKPASLFDVECALSRELGPIDSVVLPFDLAGLLVDPQYNILVLAEIVLSTWERSTRCPDGDCVAVCEDDRYGQYLVAGENAPEQDSAGWLIAVANKKNVSDNAPAWCGQQTCRDFAGPLLGRPQNQCVVDEDGEIVDQVMPSVCFLANALGTAQIQNRDDDLYAWACTAAGGLAPRFCDQELDVAFVLDTTGSMWDDLDEIKAQTQEIIDAFAGTDTRIAVVDFKDFPISPYGGSSDYPYLAALDFVPVDQPLAIESAIDGLRASGGFNVPEAVHYALLETIRATGLGGWRHDARKVIVLLGDAPPHNDTLPDRPEPCLPGYTMPCADDGNSADYRESTIIDEARRGGFLIDDDGLPVDAYTKLARVPQPIQIYSIVVGGNIAARDAFRDIAEATGGQLLAAANADDVVAAILDVLGSVLPSGNQPPRCDAATASVEQLWPPNHTMREVAILGVFDPDGDTVDVEITAITQDEPVDGRGAGKPQVDGEGLGEPTARLRAERDGRGDDRVYEISFRGVDADGATCAGSVRVCVPHDQGPNVACTDDGQAFDSTVLP